MSEKIRVEFFSYDDDCILFNESYDNIEEAEKEIADGYTDGDFNDEKGEMSVFIDGEEKGFDLIAKIKREEVSK